MSEVVTIRLDSERKNAIDYLSKHFKILKSEAIKELLDKGRAEFAIVAYKENNVSLEKAAKIAGKSVSEMIDFLAERKINANISLEDFKDSLKNVNKILRQ